MRSKKLSLPKIIAFGWDKGNINKNRLKHGVTTDECEEIFFNYPIISEDVTHSTTEPRVKAFGQTNKGRKLFVVFTLREEKIRIISARDQNKKEKEVLQK